MRRRTPLVSILIPAHNAERWIGDTLESAIAQTWEKKEIIVVDDGSSDKTFEVARRYESRAVRVIRQENRGSAGARNAAFGLSQGEFLQWLDADDLLGADKIARQMEAYMRAGSSKTLLAGPWGSFMYRVRRAQFRPTELWCDLSPVEWLLHKMQANVYMQTAVWLVSRELSEAAGAWDTRLSVDDDGEYFCRVVLASDGVRFVPDAMVYYRNLGSDSVSQIGANAKKVEAQWLSMKLQMGNLRRLEDSPRVRKACLQYVRDSLFNFYPEYAGIVAEAERLAEELGDSLGVPREAGSSL